MRIFTDKIILFLICLSLYYGEEIGTRHVVVMLLAVIVSCLGSYFWEKKYSTWFFFAFFLASFKVPECQVFFPLIWYDMLGKKVREHLALYLAGALAYGVMIYGRPAFTVIEIFLISAVASQLGKRTRAEEAAEKRLRVLRDDAKEQSLVLQKANKDLMEKQDYEVSMATLQERNRIAREIHDNVGHLLTRSILQAGAIKAINKEETLKPALEDLSATLNQAMGNIRSSVHDLHDESVDLKTAVEDLVARCDGYEAKLEYDMGMDVPKNIKYSFISIIKEALNNVTKHSNATEVRITMREQPGFYQLMIRDNGTVKAAELSDGMGLSTMRERVKSLGGTIRISHTNGFDIFIAVLKEA